MRIKVDIEGAYGLIFSGPCGHSAGRAVDSVSVCWCMHRDDCHGTGGVMTPDEFCVMADTLASWARMLRDRAIMDRASTIKDDAC